jgi:hypothetical protein
MVTEKHETLLHIALGAPLEVIKKVYSYYPEAIRMRTADGLYPLHTLAAMLIDEIVNKKTGTVETQAEVTEKFRFLLKHCPEAARLLDYSGCTPYDPLSGTTADPVKRLLLRAAPEADPLELHWLNYEARCGALYLLFVAILPDLDSASVAVPADEGNEKKKSCASTVGQLHQRALVSTQQVASSSKIWHLLKGRADTMLWKEIVLFL